MQKTDYILRLPEVEQITGMSRVTIWRAEKRGDFPQRRKITSKAVGWLASEVNEWLESRPTVDGAA